MSDLIWMCIMTSYSVWNDPGSDLMPMCNYALYSMKPTIYSSWQSTVKVTTYQFSKLVFTGISYPFRRGRAVQSEGSSQTGLSPGSCDGIFNGIKHWGCQKERRLAHSLSTNTAIRVNRLKLWSYGGVSCCGSSNLWGEDGLLIRSTSEQRDL